MFSRNGSTWTQMRVEQRWELLSLENEILFLVKKSFQRDQVDFK